MPRKSLRARGCPARAATAPAASQRDLSAPRNVPIDRNLRAQRRRSSEGTERRGMVIDLRPLIVGPTLARPSSSPGNCRCLLAHPGPHVAQPRTKIFLLQAVGASSISSLRTVMSELGRGELGVGAKARRGGAYNRMRVRTRVNAGAWQGLQRRLKAPSPSFESVP